ncbi:MAG TPA: VanZ family protein, partial [Gemmataceae bacterium]|nr:VanZ family protein [Gemmataceae bacterium]
MNTNIGKQVAMLVVWTAVFICWTISLLRPIPKSAVEAIGGPERSFWFAKCVHVSAYALLAISAAYLPGSLALRRWIPLALVLHGGLTEFLQHFVHRGASWRDVGLDTLGVAIGVVLTWPRWKSALSRCGSGGNGGR